MTAIKPPIAAWAPSTALHKLESRHNNAPCILTDGPAEFNDVALVRLADYEALQAECENLRKHLQSMIDQTTPLEPVPGNPMWSRRIQLDEVIAERESLRAECDQLRKDAERYRWLSKVTPYRFKRLQELATTDGGDVFYFHRDRFDAAIDTAMQRDNPC